MDEDRVKRQLESLKDEPREPLDPVDNALFWETLKELMRRGFPEEETKAFKRALKQTPKKVFRRRPVE